MDCGRFDLSRREQAQQRVNTRPLVAYFSLLLALCALVIAGARILGSQGAYLAQLYMLTPAVAALLARLFFYDRRFADANLKFGRIRDYVKFWLLALAIIVLSYGISTLLGAVSWDLSGKQFLGRLEQQFAAAGQDMSASLPPGFTPETMLLVYFIGGLTLFNILPGILTGFGEEFGHRGFMFPLLYRIRPWVGVVVGGVIWYLWHIPLVLIVPPALPQPTVGQKALEFLVLAVGSIFTFAYLAYVYVKAESVFVASVAHIAMNNASMSLSYITAIENRLLANVGHVIGMILLVGVLLAAGEARVFPRYFAARYPLRTS
jgi:hypothetical protein